MPTACLGSSEVVRLSGAAHRGRELVRGGALHLGQSIMMFEFPGPLPVEVNRAPAILKGSSPKGHLQWEGDSSN